MNALIPIAPASLSVEERVMRAALSGLAAQSCRVYTRHLKSFLAYLMQTRSTLSREPVEHYLATVTDASSFNQALSAIKRMTEQAAQHGWIDWTTAATIRSLRAKRILGVRAGNWLGLEQAQALVQSPDARTLTGKRDRIILALLLGTGIRRDELARLDWAQIQLREGKPYIIDLIGKGERIRSVALPAWVMPILEAWRAVSSSGRIVRSIRADGTLNGSLSTNAIRDIVMKHAASAKIDCNPHDLRRSYAKLARKNKAPLEVIQRSLGHSSITTTERYVNSGEEANAGDYFSL